MTSRWVYDDNLTDGIGLDATYSAKLTGLNLGAGCVGSAVETTLPTGEKTLTIHDATESIRHFPMPAELARLANTTRHTVRETPTGFEPE